MCKVLFKWFTKLVTYMMLMTGGGGGGGVGGGGLDCSIIFHCILTLLS